MLHPLPTLMDSHRRQVRHSRPRGHPTPRRRSAAEQRAIAERRGQSNPIAAIALGTLVPLLLVVAALALV